MRAIDDLREPYREQCPHCRRHWSACACSDDPDLATRVAIERALRDGDDTTAMELLGGNRE